MERHGDIMITDHGTVIDLHKYRYEDYLGISFNDCDRMFNALELDAEIIEHLDDSVEFYYCLIIIDTGDEDSPYSRSGCNRRISKKLFWAAYNEYMVGDEAYGISLKDLRKLLFRNKPTFYNC